MIVCESGGHANGLTYFIFRFLRRPQGRYETLVGAPAPVAAGIGHGADHHRFLAAQLGIEVAAARELDLQAREQVAAELGHGRIDVTNAYLG